MELASVAMPSIVVTSRAVGLDGEHRAALHGLAVDVDGAGAALARVAPDVGAGEVQVLTDRLDEEPSRLDVELVGRPVDHQGDVFSHRPDLLRRLPVRLVASTEHSRFPAPTWGLC